MLNFPRENQRLLTVHLSNGAQVTCTPYHKFITNSKTNTVKLPSGNYKYVYDSIKDAVRIDAKDLKIGQQLVKYELPVIEYGNENDIAFPYTHGFFCGDGTYHKNPSGYIGKGLSLYGEKKKLIPYLQIRSSSYKQDANGKINTMLPDEIPDKYVVPFNTSLKCRLEWLAGLFDADATCTYNKNTCSIQLGSVELEFLNNIQLLLTTMGVHSKISKLRDETQQEMPDGKGGHKLYTCRPFYRLLIASSGIQTLLHHGLETHRLIIKNKELDQSFERFIKVTGILDEGRIDDTYCFNEPENHAGVFNGVCLGNCSEIIEYSSPTESAVCNLASLALPAYVRASTRTFDFAKLREVVKVVIKNLNRVIDINFYPTQETKTSNMRHRPVGLGVQGLSDVFALLRVPWESEQAAELNQLIFEHIYYAAVESSCEIAQTDGPYSTFEGSPMSQGLFQYDLWKVTPRTAQEGGSVFSEEKDQTLPWASLKDRVKAHGVRNSLLVAPMPTASTSQIMGNTEAVEPLTSNIYSRRTLAGEFIVINKHLMADLKKLDLWNEMMKQQIIARNGSIQGIDIIPEGIQKLYKTAWEIKQKTLIDMAAARGAFICQSQSLNLFVADPNYAKLTSMHFYGWKKGLKTGQYYLRTRAPIMAQKFTIDPELQKAAAKSEMERTMKKRVISSDNGEECLMCGS